MPTDKYDRSIPLKAIKVQPPSASVVHSQSTYKVHIELSRNGSKWEKDAVQKFFPQGRIYSNTLELSDTTVEAIAAGAQTIYSQLASLEREARIAEDADIEIQRKQDEEYAAEVARHENLTRIASEIRFE